MQAQQLPLLLQKFLIDIWTIRMKVGTSVRVDNVFQTKKLIINDVVLLLSVNQNIQTMAHQNLLEMPARLGTINRQITYCGEADI